LKTLHCRNWQDGDGWSPLVVAIYGGHEEAAVSLIDAGADISLTTKDGWSPVFVSSFYGRMSVLKSLVKKRVDVNVKTRGGWTPLMVAVTRNEIEVAETLLAAGARDEINHVAKCDGDSALSLAAKGRFEGMCRLLISSGAKIELAIKDKAGRTITEVKAFLEGL
jgi:ankyrin